MGRSLSPKIFVAIGTSSILNVILPYIHGQNTLFCEWIISFLFSQDFIDVSGRQGLETEAVKENVQDRTDSNEDSISEEEMNTVCKIHQAVFTLLSNADWLRQAEDIEVKVKDIVKPVLASHTVMTSLVKLVYQYLSKFLIFYFCLQFFALFYFSFAFFYSQKVKIEKQNKLYRTSINWK